MLAFVKFLPEGKRTGCTIGETILEASRKGNVDLAGPCAGRALCGKCVVRVIEGESQLTSPTSDEVLALGGELVSEGHRLACRSCVARTGEVAVFTPSGSRLGGNVLLAEARVGDVELNPAVRKLRTSQTRAISILGGNPPSDAGHESSPLRARLLDPAAKTEGEITLVMRGEQVLDVGVDPPILGFAVDIGTTKIAGYLVDLTDGKTLSVVTELNPQIAWGEDVVSRLSYALNGGRKKLQSEVVECINSLLERACGIAGTRRENVYEFVIVGNTVMHHLLLGLEIRSLAFAPYAAKIGSAQDLASSDLRLSGGSRSRVYMPPLIASFVGADAVSDMLATKMNEASRPTILVDIGTNTEIVMRGESRTLACSAASGPAFEGAHIKFGMRAATGAVDTIRIAEDGTVRYTVIGGGKPRGITGSAVVDAIAELHRIGLVDDSGRLAEGTEGRRILTDSKGQKEFVLIPRTETADSQTVTLSQRDIREIQLAKAAIRAGLDILMGELDLDPRTIETMYIAGAFGFFLNPVSAKAIGLYQEIAADRIRLVGNAAVAGARQLLLSTKSRNEAEEVVKRVEYVDLATRKDFRKIFLASMALPHAA